VDEYVVVAGLLAHGSSLLSGLPETHVGFSDVCWTTARRLQLRGQRRHYTGFPLSSGSSKTRRTSTVAEYLQGDCFVNLLNYFCGIPSGMMVCTIEISRAS